jgi:hypothetical protein
MPVKLGDEIGIKRHSYVLRSITVRAFPHTTGSRRSRQLPFRFHSKEGRRWRSARNGVPFWISVAAWPAMQSFKEFPDKERAPSSLFSLPHSSHCHPLIPDPSPALHRSRIEQRWYYAISFSSIVRPQAATSCCCLRRASDWFATNKGCDLGQPRLRRLFCAVRLTKSSLDLPITSLLQLEAICF